MKLRSWFKLAAIAVLGGVFAVQITSCSLVGLGIGTLIDDNRHTRYDPTTPAHLVTIERGTDIELRLNDSTTVSGRFEGWSLIADSTYAPRYAAWRARHVGGLRPPELGDRMMVNVEPAKKSRESQYAITGDPVPPNPFASHDAVFGGWAPFAVMIAPPNNPFLAEALADIDSLAHAGGEGVPRDSLLAWLSEFPPPPMRIALKLRQQFGTQAYPGERVTLVGIGAPKNGKTIGLLVGAGVDLTILIAAAAASQSSGAGCDGGTYNGGGFYLRSQPGRGGTAAPAPHRP